MATLQEKNPKEIGRALLKALKEGNQEAAKYFLSAPEVDVRCYQDDGLYTALHFAATKNYVEVTQAILSKGANINAQDKEGCTALHYVSKEGYDHIVRILLDKGAAPNIKATRYFHTALHFAALMGHAGIVRLLLDKNADASVQDKDNATPLHYATKSGRFEVVQILLEKAEANGESDKYLKMRAKNNFTPLHYAITNGYQEVTEFLLNKGADCNAQDDKNYTALHMAAHNGNVDIVRLLLLKGADVSSVGKDGKRPQNVTRNPKILADLQAFGAIIEGFTPPEGYQPLEASFSEKQEKIKEFNIFEKYFT